MQTYVVENANLRLTGLDYGARIVEIFHKELGRNLVLSYPRMEDYLRDPNYLGATIGPNANRIAGGVFSLFGKEQLWDQNDGPNNLHSGSFGLDHQLWQGSVEGETLHFQFIQERPFFCRYQADFRLDGERILVEYRAQVEEAALVNMTNHSYFHLDQEETVLDYQLHLFADFYTPFDGANLPTGEVVKVQASPFDFTKPRSLRQALATAKEAGSSLASYDHNFVSRASGLHPIAEIVGSDITLSIFATAPAFQLYTAGNLLWEGRRRPFAAICVEPQYIPNSIHIPYFAQPISSKENPYVQKIIYAFSTKNSKDL